MLSIKLGMIKKKAAGTFEVYVQVVRDNGEIAGQGSYVARNAAEFKEKLKPMFSALVEAEKNKDTIKTIAQTVVDEIMTEVSQ